MEPYCEGRNHKNNICVKDHQKEGTEKVEYFCEKIPAVLSRNQLYEILPEYEKKLIIYEILG